ncbi:hypothetical protein EMIT0194P_170125 [Pseudomonas serbica]
MAQFLYGVKAFSMWGDVIFEEMASHRFDTRYDITYCGNRIRILGWVTNIIGRKKADWG